MKLFNVDLSFLISISIIAATLSVSHAMLPGVEVDNVITEVRNMNILDENTIEQLDTRLGELFLAQNNPNDPIQIAECFHDAFATIVAGYNNHLQNRRETEKADLLRKITILIRNHYTQANAILGHLQEILGL